jgi:hypothetical protein
MRGIKMRRMSWSGTELGRRVDGRIELRPETLRLRVRLGDVPTADVHLIDVEFTASLRALDQRGEREMFAEAFLSGRDAVHVDDVAAHFAPALHRALCALAKTQGAEHWTSDASRAAMIEAIRAAARPVAFASGVELLPPFDCVVSSRTLVREKLDQMERALSQRRVAGHVENVQRATELLREFAALRDAMPDVAAGRLLQQVAPSTQGSMLQSLLMASAADATASLFAVAGPNLLKIDPRAIPPAVQTIPLPTDLGPLRSVQADGGRLLIGAQSGVIMVDPAQPDDATLLRDPEITSPLGFNAVARTGQMIWATHSEGGIVAWNIGDGAKPQAAFRDLKQARNLAPLDDRRIVFSTADQVFITQTDSAPTTIATSPAPIMLIHVDGGRIDVIRASGEIEQLDRGTLARQSLHRRAGALTAAGALPFLGSTRLLLATADGPVYCVGGDDPLVTQYLSAHRGLRAVTACADIVAALSADRQRIILWNSWAGESPLAEIHVAAIARHRAADICF